MFFPIPPIGPGAQVNSPPPDFFYYMKIAFSILLLFQLVIAGCRFYLIDILGGVVLTLTAVFGIFVVRFDFLLTWLFPYAMICTVNGLFGSVLIIE